MTDVNESEKSVTDQPPTSESQPATAIDAIDNTSSETTAAPDHSEHTRKSSKVETSREIVTKSNEEARKTSSSSLKSAHRLNSSSKSSIQHPERSETLPPTRKKTKKSITLPMPMLQETQQQNEPPITSARSSISTTATTLSDSPRPMKYASIDLENEIPEIFSSSLNPAIQDPDMSEFYSRPTPFYQMKTPPPLYSNRKVSTPLSFPSATMKPRSTYVEKKTRMKIWLTLFILVFFIFPIAVLIMFRLIPYLMNYLNDTS